MQQFYLHPQYFFCHIIIFKYIMGPVAVPLFFTAYGGTAAFIGSRAISTAIAHDNYVSYKLQSVDRSDKVIEIRVRSCWLKHGALSALGSAITGPITGSSCTHWWVQIQTEKGWYCAQLNIGGVYLHRHSSLGEVNRCGLSQGGNDSDGNITTKKTWRPSSRTMGDVYDWVQNSDNNYDLVNHNCQDWANEFYRWI